MTRKKENNKKSWELWGASNSKELLLSLQDPGEGAVIENKLVGEGRLTLLMVFIRGM